MDQSLILLICGIAATALALVFCLFGYRLARFLLPICSVLAIEGLVYAFLYDIMALDPLGTWLFYGGCGVALYILFFFLKRPAGFFAGLLGSALLLLFVVTALDGLMNPDLSAMPYVIPACFALCLLTAVLAVAYKRVGVIVSTALFGGSAAAFLGLFIYFFGVDVADFTAYGNILVPLDQYLSTNTYLVGGAALGLSILGLLVQLFWTGKTQVLSGEDEGKSFHLRRHAD